MTFVKPSPLGASKAAVYSFAEDVAKHVKYEIGENMRAFVSRLGGRISFHEEVQPGDEFPESIIVQPSGEFQIFLPTVTTAERDRFTIAHELGHLFLHFPKVNATIPASLWLRRVKSIKLIKRKDAQSGKRTGSLQHF